MSSGNRFGLLHLTPERPPLTHGEVMELFEPCELTLRNPMTGMIHVTQGDLLRLETERELDARLADPQGLCLQLWWGHWDRATYPDDLVVVLERNEQRHSISYSYFAPVADADGPLPAAWERCFDRFRLEGTALALLRDATGQAQDVDWQSWLADPRPLPPPYPDLMIVPIATADAFALDDRLISRAALGSRWCRIVPRPR